MDIISMWNKVHLKKLSDSQMRKMGFEDLAESRWMFRKHDDFLNVTFVLILNKNNQKKKVRIIDRETKKSYALENINFKINEENKSFYNFLKGIYIGFSKEGFI